MYHVRWYYKVKLGGEYMRTICTIFVIFSVNLNCSKRKILFKNSWALLSFSPLPHMSILLASILISASQGLMSISTHACFSLHLLDTRASKKYWRLTLYMWHASPRLGGWVNNEASKWCQGENHVNGALYCVKILASKNQSNCLQQRNHISLQIMKRRKEVLEWLSQSSVWLLTAAQVNCLRVPRSSPGLVSLLTWDSACVPFPLPLPFPCSLPHLCCQNKWNQEKKEKEKNKERKKKEKEKERKSQKDQCHRIPLTWGI